MSLFWKKDEKSSPPAMDKMSSKQEIHKGIETVAHSGYEHNQEAKVASLIQDDSQKNIKIAPQLVTDGKPVANATPNPPTAIVDGILSSDVQEVYGKNCSGPMPIESNLECDENNKLILKLICKYGYISDMQIRHVLPEGSTSDESVLGLLKSLVINDTTIYWHTKESLKWYSYLAHIPLKELTTKAVLCDVPPIEKLAEIQEQTDILLSFEKNQCEVYDWVSAFNIRRQRMLKIKIGKRETLEPELVVVLKKSQKYTLVFDRIVSYDAFSPGERVGGYHRILMAYNNWLSKPEEVQKWLSKRRLFVHPNNLAVALLLPTSEGDLVDDLLEVCENLSITTPIFFAERKEFLQKPLGCWHSNSEGNSLLKCRKKSKK